MPRYFTAPMLCIAVGRVGHYTILTYFYIQLQQQRWAEYKYDPSRRMDLLNNLTAGIENYSGSIRLRPDESGPSWNC